MKLPKNYHPDFRIPGKKPVGDVEVDRREAFGKLCNFALCSNQPHPVDLHDNTLLSIDSAVTWTPRGWYFDGTTNGYIEDSRTDKFQCAKSFSLVFVATPDNSATDLNPTFISRGDTGTSEWMLRHNKSGGFGVYANSGQHNVFSSSVIVNKEPAVFGYSFKQTGSGNRESYLYYNGELVASNTTGIIAGSVAKALQIGGGDSAVGRRYKGYISDVFGFDGITLSAEDHAALAKNPYQILKPANQLTHFSAEVVQEQVTTTTKAYSLPKKYHPDFRIPGKKPIGSVRLSADRRWSVVVLAESGEPGRDFVGNSLSFGSGVSVDDNAYKFNGSYQQGVIATGNTLQSTDFCVVAIVKLSSDNIAALATSRNSNPYGTTLWVESTKLSMGKTGNAKAVSATFPSINDGSYHVLGWKKSGNTAYFYLDGRYIGSGGNASGDPAEGGGRIGEANGWGYMYSGWLRLYAETSELLSDSQMRALTSRPYYEIFNPANPIHLPIQVSGGGGSVVPGPQTFIQVLSSTITFAQYMGRTISTEITSSAITYGESTKGVTNSITGDVLPEGNTGKQAQPTRTGSVTSSSFTGKDVFGTRDGEILIEGNPSKDITTSNEGNITPVAGLLGEGSLAQDNLGNVTPTGSMTRVPLLRMLGTVTGVGVLRKQMTKTLYGESGFSKYLQKQANTVIEGDLTPVGTVGYAMVLGLLVLGAVTFSSILQAVYIVGAGPIVAVASAIRNIKPILKSVFVTNFKDNE